MNQFFSLTGVSLDYPLPTIIFNILFAFLVGFIIATVYKKTHKGLSYSSSFTFTLVLLTVSGSILMMIVGNSLARAFSLFGAFSIIRFRTAVKETRDIAFVFIALILGMAVGTNNYTIAVLSTAIISAGVYYMTKKRFGAISEIDHLLTFQFPQNASTKSLFSVFTKYLDSHQLVNLTSFQKQKTTEMTYNIKLKSSYKPQEFINQLKKIKGTDSLRLVSLEDQAIN